MILMNDFRREPPELRNAMLAAMARVVESGHYILGPELQAFEFEWARFCGVPFAVGVGNGMDAIEISIRALGIGPGDEVVTTPMTAFATVLAIMRSGAVPVLADIDPSTALLDIESVRRCLSSRTRAVVLVHLYGQLRGLRHWSEFCELNGLQLIEDCAQAHGASEAGHMAGSIGAAGAYSFYPTKNLGAIGDGGMVVTRSADVCNRASQLRNYGQAERYIHPIAGLNSRLDEMQAAVLSERLRWLPKFVDRRRAIADMYLDGIQNPTVNVLQRPAEHAAHVYHLFVVTSGQREPLQRYLHDQGVQTLLHYPLPVHMQACTAALARDPQGLKNAERHAQTCLSLPCHPQMPDEEVARVIDAVNGFGG